MGDAAVDDVGAGDSALQGLEAALNLGNHAGGDDAGGNHGGDGIPGNALDEAGGILYVTEDTGYIGELDEFLCLQCHGNLGGGGVGIDVVAVHVALLTQGYGGHHRDKALLQQGLEDFGMHLGNIAHKAQVLTVRVNLPCPKEAGIHTAQAHGTPATLQQQPHDVLVQLAGEHHLHHLHGLSIGVAQTVDKAGLLAHPFQHGIDFRPAAVNQHHVDSDGVQKHNVLHDGGLQLLVEHGISAVLYHHGLSYKLLEIGQGLNQYVSPIFVTNIHFTILL